jgi:hypothetical protein
MPKSGRSRVKRSWMAAFSVLGGSATFSEAAATMVDRQELEDAERRRRLDRLVSNLAGLKPATGRESEQDLVQRASEARTGHVATESLAELVAELGLVDGHR